MINETCVTYEVSGPVAFVRMNRPEALNAVNTALRESLFEALQRAERDPAVGVILLGSTGRGFCAGADLMEEKTDEFSVEDELLLGYRPLLEKIARTPLPVIGVAPGVAAGVGAALLMNCDLVVMAQTAKLYFAFSHIGLVPDGGATWLLHQHLGYQRAFELIVEGGNLSAADCLALGIANKVVPEEELEKTAEQWARELAMRSPLATREAKKLLHAAATQTYAQMFEREAQAQDRCFNSEESRTAVAAFKQKKASKG